MAGGGARGAPPVPARAASWEKQHEDFPSPAPPLLTPKPPRRAMPRATGSPRDVPGGDFLTKSFEISNRLHIIFFFVLFDEKFSLSSPDPARRSRGTRAGDGSPRRLPAGFVRFCCSTSLPAPQALPSAYWGVLGGFASRAGGGRTCLCPSVCPGGRSPPPPARSPPLSVTVRLCPAEPHRSSLHGLALEIRRD